MKEIALYPEEYFQVINEIKKMGSGSLNSIGNTLQKGEILTLQEVVKSTVYSRREDYSYEHMSYTGIELVVRVMFVREDKPGWQHIFVTLPNLLEMRSAMWYE